MIRVKDHEKSLKFYQDVMGMTLMRTSENKDANFNLYFLGYPGDKGVPTSSSNGVNPTADREGLLELTWNYGTEKDASFKYHNGNDEPQGFGHICKLGMFLVAVRQLTRDRRVCGRFGCSMPTL
jgi:lactoylglutathione lyase